MSWRKITTSKYVVYPTGQVYRGGKFFRTLMGWQNDYVMSEHWNSKAKKQRLDDLIDEDFENLKMEITK